MFLSLSFSFVPPSGFQTLFCLVNPRADFFCDGQTDDRRGRTGKSQRAAVRPQRGPLSVMILANKRYMRTESAKITCLHIRERNVCKNISILNLFRRPKMNTSCLRASTVTRGAQSGVHWRRGFCVRRTVAWAALVSSALVDATFMRLMPSVD